MGSYNVLFKRSAEKELRGISKPHLAKIVEKIKTLSQNPRPQGIQLLKGEDRYFRLRQGDYRIIYEIDDTNQIILIIKIGHRREVYD
ncbi:MAG: type II toxin-antitoxin system RelE/ParE family toxin [Candidatus Omnitrophica bacterium]|nr:type II toxin-antitoxin system RelE/ParE family toxin [Candidatus Omnitrophota bacterium]